MVRSFPAPSRWHLPVPAAVLLLVSAQAACAADEPASRQESPAQEAPSPATPPTSVEFTYGGPALDDLPAADEATAEARETERDWAIVRGTVAWGHEQGLDLLPVGEAAGIVGSTFVGAPYEPGTLELPGPEELVVNLRAFDCVTFVEHVLALSRIIVEADADLLDDTDGLRARYRDELTRMRYRGGRLDGYESRLHYFSEWIRDAETKGLVRDVSAELSGVPDSRPIHFMSSNPDAYPKLADDPDRVERIRSTEERISALPRYYIPQDRIGEVAEEIRNGDVIAAVSTVDGLDVAHTGIALWHAGRLHLLHAPLVGESVEISRLPLAERIQGISGQKGIMVARPVHPSSG